MIQSFLIVAICQLATFNHINYNSSNNATFYLNENINITNLYFNENINDNSEEIESITIGFTLMDCQLAYLSNNTYDYVLSDGDGAPYSYTITNANFLNVLNSYKRQLKTDLSTYIFIKYFSIAINFEDAFLNNTNKTFDTTYSINYAIETINGDLFDFTDLNGFVNNYSIPTNIYNSLNYGSNYTQSHIVNGGIAFENDLFNIYFDSYTAGVGDIENQINSAYQNGYESGYEDGYEDGDEYGYNVGYEDGERDGYNKKYDFLEIIKGAFDAVSNFFNMEIFPGVKFIYIIGIPIVIAVLRFVIGWFR